jgi:hypothetical protein
MVSSTLSSFFSCKLVTESAMEIQQKILSSSIGNIRTQLLQGQLQQQSHRHTHEIIKQILQTVHSRTRKGHYCKSLDIAYGCELTWAQFRQYRFKAPLNFLSAAVLALVKQQYIRKTVPVIWLGCYLVGYNRRVIPK